MNWTANRLFALIVGVLFTVIGLLGFVASPTMARGNLLGFDIDLVHNLIHLVTGLIGLATVFLGGFRRFNQAFGVVYIVLGILGLIYPGLYFHGLFLGITHINAADHILHLVFGIIGAYLGFAFKEETFEPGAHSRETPMP
jgi:hypothetical protein